MLHYARMTDPSSPPPLPRIVRADHLVGARVACERFGFDRSTLVRKIAKGEIEPLTQLDGPNGAYVFDINELPAEVAS